MQDTMRAERAAFARRQLVPRVLRDVAVRDTGVELFGRRLPAPLLLAPTRRAVDAGADGLIVSTHGGRQVDGARGALDSLPEVVAAVDGEVPVLMDSGVRGGADVLKAVALGASAVCLGRPYALALGLAGRIGVSEVIANLIAEFDLTLRLCGYSSVAEVGPDVLADPLVDQALPARAVSSI